MTTKKLEGGRARSRHCPSCGELKPNASFREASYKRECSTCHAKRQNDRLHAKLEAEELAERVKFLDEQRKRKNTIANQSSHRKKKGLPSLTKKDQQLLAYNGETLNWTQWARKLGMKKSTFRNRIKAGWPIERVMTEPVGANWRGNSYLAKTNAANAVAITFNGETHSYYKWEKLLGLPSGIVWKRIHRGWSPERALTTPPITRDQLGVHNAANLKEGRAKSSVYRRNLAYRKIWEVIDAETSY